ncbi:FNIP repeat-containing protein [Tieghemostelium lacteum]|uniref:FNIP repeat-containing protein n=1 Tax=Tieghemostelium lacteum TaxID=361077 RepID=A0A152A382_TIELA|nr:FNIP repeat-containing protein [Tieghemostelium lacteum]|eukprot:KYR00664.1 FNIP repeat-containing protein [Tieghemostelium lacteum]
MSSQNLICTKSRHLKSTDLYCSDCKSLFCSKCIGDHRSHSTVDSDDYFEEIIKQSKEHKNNLEQCIIIKKQEIEDNQNYFKKDIQSHYDKQVDLVDELFRELHDQLHMKQVEIKRELKSHHDNNLEQLTLILSEIETDLTKHQNTISDINNYHDDRKIDRHQYIQNLNDSLHSQSKNNTDTNQYQTDENQYHLPFVDQTKMNITLNSIPLIVIDRVKHITCNISFDYYNSNNNNNNNNNNKKKYTEIIRYSKEKGLERLDLEKGKVSVISNTNPSQNNMILDTNFRLCENCTINGRVYLFGNNGSCIMMNTLQQPTKTWTLCTWTPPNVINPSAISDGTLIFLFGGNKKDTTPLSNIYKIDTRLNQCLWVGNLKSPCIGTLLEWDEDGNILIIGGQSGMRNSTRIEKFNPRTNHLETIVDSIPGLYVDSNFYYCYVDRLKSLYILESLECAQFLIKFNLNSKEITKHKITIKLTSFNSKMLYDNEEHLYIFRPSKKSMWTYNIITDHWVKEKNNLNQVNERQYYSFNK